MAFTTREFARRLRQLREQAGWTQEQLAERAGLSRNYIGLLELSRREPSLATLLSLSQALSSSLDGLVGASLADHPAPAREDQAPYRDKPKATGGSAALRVQEALRQCDPKDRELIAGIVDNCLRLSRKTR